MNTFTTATRYDHGLDWEQPLRVQSMQSTLTASRTARPDMHYALHMGIVLEGAMLISYPDFSLTAGPGQAWFTACWEPHVGRALQDTKLVLFTVLLDALGHVAPFAQIRWEIPFLSPVQERPQMTSRESQQATCELGCRIAAAQKMEKSGNQIQNWLWFHELLLPFALSSHREASPSAGSLTRVLPALELVRDAHRIIGVDKAAEACGLGRRRFCELFRLSLGISFGRFALRARLSGAASDLRGSDEPIKQIANRWDFHDSSHFHRAFVANFGLPPSAFRRENRDLQP